MYQIIAPGGGGNTMMERNTRTRPYKPPRGRQRPFKLAGVSQHHKTHESGVEGNRWHKGGGCRSITSKEGAASYQPSPCSAVPALSLLASALAPCPLAYPCLPVLQISAQAASRNTHTQHRPLFFLVRLLFFFIFSNRSIFLECIFQLFTCKS